MGISHYSLTPIQYTMLMHSEFGDIYTVSQKNKTLDFLSLFIKCEPIFKILSLPYSSEN